MCRPGLRCQFAKPLTSAVAVTLVLPATFSPAIAARPIRPYGVGPTWRLVRGTFGAGQNGEMRPIPPPKFDREEFKVTPKVPEIYRENAEDDAAEYVAWALHRVGFTVHLGEGDLKGTLIAVSPGGTKFSVRELS